MVTAVLAVMLAAAPSLAMPGLNPVNVGRAEADLYSDLLGQRLASGGVKIMSARDLGAVLGLERQKQLLGCGESSCIAELAGALGTDGIVLGDVGKLGTSLALNVKVLSAQGALLAQYNAQVPSADEMPSALEVAASALLGQLARSLHQPQLEPKALAPSPLRAVAPVALAIGGVALAGGAACLVVTGVKYSAVQNAQTVQDANLFATQGKLWQPIGYVLAGVGAAGLITGAIMMLAGPQPVVPTVTILPGGGGSVGVAGVLP
jgi:hypothetical protein